MLAPRLQGSQAAAAAVGRLRALGLAAVTHVVRVRLDAAAVVLPRQLLPGGRLAGVRRRSRAHRAGARRRHPDALDGRAHRRREAASRSVSRSRPGSGRSGEPFASTPGTSSSNARSALTLEQMLGPAMVGERAIATSRRCGRRSPCFLAHIRPEGRQRCRTRAGVRLPLAIVEPGRRRSRRVQDFHPDDVRSRRWRRPTGRSSSCSGSWRLVTTGRAIGASTRDIEDDLWRGSSRKSRSERARRAAQSASALTSWRFTLNFTARCWGGKCRLTSWGRPARALRARSATCIYAAIGPGRGAGLRRYRVGRDVAAADYRRRCLAFSWQLCQIPVLPEH